MHDRACLRSVVAILVACAASLAVPHAAVAVPGLPHAVVTLPSLPGRCSDARLPAPVRERVPWCSIRAAILAAPPGGTVKLSAGTYPYQQLHGLGLRKRFVTIESAGYGGPNPANVTIQGISTANVSHLRFRGLHLVGSDDHGFRPAARIYIGSRSIQLVDVDMSGEGVLVQSASYVRIARSRIHDVRRNCTLHNIGDGGGIFVQRSSHVSIIRNHIEGTIQDALNFGAIPYVLVRGNVLSNASFRMCGDHTDLVQIEGGGRGPMTFVDNVFHDGGQFILRNATGLTVADNLIVRVRNWMQVVATPGARIVNNVWWRGNRGCPSCGSLLIRQKGAFPYANHMSGAVIEHNIMRLFANAGVPRPDYREDYNVVYGPRANSTGIETSHTRAIFDPQDRHQTRPRLGRKARALVLHLLRVLRRHDVQPQIVRVVARIERRWSSRAHRGSRSHRASGHRHHRVRAGHRRARHRQR